MKVLDLDIARWEPEDSDANEIEDLIWTFKRVFNLMYICAPEDHAPKAVDTVPTLQAGIDSGAEVMMLFHDRPDRVVDESQFNSLYFYCKVPEAAIWLHTNCPYPLEELSTDELPLPDL